MEVVQQYTRAWLLLQYDERRLPEKPDRPVTPAAGLSLGDARAIIAHLRETLVARGEASDLFGAERSDQLAGILGATEQTFDGVPLYPTVQAVRDLSRFFALAVPHEDALRIRDDVAFFQAVAAVLNKHAPGERKPQEELDLAVRQIVSRAVAPEGVIDIFAAAGLQKPDISILSDEFLAEVRGMPRRKKNVVQARSFAAMLEQAIRKYQNRAIEAAQVIEEMIALAKDMRRASERGATLKLSDEELAFYDALETNESAVQVLGDETLRTIAREVTDAVRKNVTIDWTMRENVRAQLRVIVKRILRKYGYPPDKQEKATQTVLEQVELLGWEVAA